MTFLNCVGIMFEENRRSCDSVHTVGLLYITVLFALTHEVCALRACRHVTIIHLYFLLCQQTQCIMGTVMGHALAHTGLNKDLRDSVVFGCLC